MPSISPAQFQNYPIDTDPNRAPGPMDGEAAFGRYFVPEERATRRVWPKEPVSTSLFLPNATREYSHQNEGLRGKISRKLGVKPYSVNTETTR